MNKKQLEDIVESSAMINFDKIQRQLDPVSSIFRESDKTLKKLEDLGPMKVLSQYKATQGLMEQYTKNFTLNAAYLNNDTIRTMRDLIDSISNQISTFEALKLNTSLQRTLETACLASKPPTQFVFPKGWDSGSEVSELNSVMSRITKSIDQFSVLESFKALSRLENFPFSGIATTESENIPNLEENASATVLELDSKISDELSTVDDFNQLSEDRRTILINLYRDYYYPLILNSLVIIMYLQDFLEQKLDLTNNTFIFVEKSKEKLSYISNVYRPNPSAIMDNIVAGGALMLLAKILGFS